MAESELKEIRKQRLTQLHSQYEGDESTQNIQKSKDEKSRAQDDAKNSILSQILDQSARARLNTLMLGKPDKGRMVENMLIRMAQAGEICTKIGEKELIGLLESVNKQMHSKTSVKFDRRRAALDSDNEDYNF